MSILAITETWNGRRAQDTDSQIGAIYVRVFNVLTDDPTTEAAAILTDVNIPGILATYQDANGNVIDDTALCVRRYPEQSAVDPRWWQVRCEYSTDTVANAVLDAADWEITTEFVPEAYLLCYAQDAPRTDPWNTADITYDDPQIGSTDPARPTIAIRNSADDPYDPPPEDQRTLTKFVITRNESTNPFDKKRTFEQTVNGDVTFGVSKGYLYMASITGTLVNPTHGSAAYWKVRYEILHDPRGHSLKLLDAGYNYLNGGVSQKILDTTTGLPYAKPMPLDGSGGVLAVAGTYLYNRYAVRRAIPWAPLSLPDLPT